MSEAPIVYMFDEDNYYYRQKYAQKSPKGDKYLFPECSTQVQPALDGKHFAKWDPVQNSWVYELIPQTVEDFVGVRVSHTSQTDRNRFLRELIQKFAADSEKYRLCRGSEDEGLWWGIELIPEPTTIELKSRRISELKGNLASTDYVVAKIAEGVATKEDYPEVLSNRQLWRQEINDLEAEIETLKADTVS